MSHRKITFVVQTDNHSSRVLRTLPLLRASTGRLAHEIVVIDSGGPDGTAEVIAERFPQVRLIELDAGPAAAARNVAIAAAGAEFVFLLDDATWPDKGTTEFALRTMAEQPRLAAADCRIRTLGEPPRPETGGPSGLLSGTAVVLRRQAILAVGGYPLDCGDLADCDLSARLWRGGWQVKHFEAMTVCREADAAPLEPISLPNAFGANSLRFWSRYSPAERYEDFVGESVTHCRTHRRPLTLAQFDCLVGVQETPVRPQQVAMGVPTAA